MIKEFLMRKMLERQLKDVPKEDQEKMINMITKNPELFQKIATEVKAKVDGTNGGPKMDQMKATMEVMKNYESELRALKQD
jgi:hypothetical protein